MFDITISTLSTDTGREQADLPGLYVASSHRKAARLRAQDQLLVYMKASGNASLSAVEQQDMLAKTAETYYTSSGPITSGLREAATSLNEALLARNLRGAKEGPATVALHLAVLHSGTLLLAMAGAAHTFLLTKDQVQLFDEAQGSRGLGLTKQILPRFYQATVEPGDILLFSANPPAAWTAQSLAGGSQLGMDHLRRRLLGGAAGSSVEAVMVRLQNSGKGKVNWFRPSAAPAQVKTGAAIQADTSDQKESLAQPAYGEAPVVKKPEKKPGFHILRPAQKKADDSQPVARARPFPPPSRPEKAESLPVKAPERAIPARQAQPIQAEPARPSPEAAPSTPPPKPKAVRSRGPNPVALQLSKMIQSTAGFFAAHAPKKKASVVAVEDGGVKIAPRRSELFFNLSPAAMLFVAICVPLVVVAAATAVYVKAGRSEEMAVNLAGAQRSAELAAKQTDPSQQRDGWNQVLVWVNQANQYGQSDAADQLQLQAQSALDKMDGIVRLDFQPARQNAFTADVNITRMAATMTDVYLLDSSQGRILRLYRTSSGYEVDTTFVCGGKQKTGGVQTLPLVDLMSVPPNNELRATIMGIDSAGTLVYCAPTKDGFDSRALPPPDTNWGQILAARSVGDMLYVLDPKVNAVWSFPGRSGIFDQSPRLFFDNQVPKMTDVIDLAVDQEYLYLLHETGEMSVCESSGFEFAPTHCTDPQPYGDSRLGRSASPLNFDDAHFVQMQVTTPPDPSLYILDDKNNAVYHFSQRLLNFQRQYREGVNPDFPFPDTPATAFLVTSNRRIFIAFKNQVFFAQIP